MTVQAASADTTPDTVASDDLGTTPDCALLLTATLSVHGAQVRPSPDWPAGQGPQPLRLAQLTPAAHWYTTPQPYGGGGDGDGEGGMGGDGGAAMVASVGGVVSTTPVTVTPTLLMALCSTDSDTPPVVVILVLRLADAVALDTNTCGVEGQ